MFTRSLNSTAIAVLTSCLLAAWLTPAAAQQPGEPQFPLGADRTRPSHVPFELNPQEHANLSAVLSKWHERSTSTHTLGCSFKIWEHDPSIGSDSEYYGYLRFSAPDKALYQVSHEKVPTDTQGQPGQGEWKKLDGEFWSCNGNSIFGFRHEDKQLIERPTGYARGKAIHDGPLPLRLAIDATPLLGRYYLRLVATDESGQICIEGYPRYQREAAEFHKVELVLDERELLLIGITFHRPNHARTVFRFRDFEVNAERAGQSSDFTPRVPVGYEHVIEQPITQDAPEPQPTPIVAFPPKRPRADEGPEFLWWLPADTEGIYVARGDIPKVLFAPEPEPAQAPTAMIASGDELQSQAEQDPGYDFNDAAVMVGLLPFLNPIRLEKPARFRLVQEHLQHNISQVVQAGRNANYLHQGACETCSLVFLKRRNGPDFLEAISPYAKQRMQIGQRSVLAVSSETSNMKVRPVGRWYLACPRDDLLVSSSDLDLLYELIERTDQRGESRALPSDLPEWKLVDTSSPIWALRRYGGASWATDPTNLSFWDPKATGIVASMVQTPQPAMVIRCRSTSPDAEARFAKLMEAWHGRPAARWYPIERVNAEYLEARIVIGGEKSAQRLTASKQHAVTEHTLFLQPLHGVGAAAPWFW